MLHTLFYLETTLHVSVGTTTHHQERKQLCLWTCIRIFLRCTDPGTFNSQHNLLCISLRPEGLSQLQVYTDSNMRTVAMFITANM
jgi:hypothetical protein